MAITISVLGLIILLLVLFVIFRKKNQPAGNPSNAATIRLKETSEFHSASIRLGARACDAAKQMSGQRILSKEVPGLPLPDCDRAECYCKFVHHPIAGKVNRDAARSRPASVATRENICRNNERIPTIGVPICAMMNTKNPGQKTLPGAGVRAMAVGQ